MPKWRTPSDTPAGSHNFGFPSLRRPWVEQINYPSVVPSADCTQARHRPEYSGDEIIGLGTMHKSATVPVTSRQQAIDIARMRRN